VPDPVHQGQQLGCRHRNARQRAAELDLARLDPAAQADLLLGRQQMDLADLLEVEPDGVLGRGRAGAQRLLGQGGGFLEDDGCGLLLVLQLDPGRLGLDLGQGALAQPGLWLSESNLRMDGLGGLGTGCFPERHGRLVSVWF